MDSDVTCDGTIGQEANQKPGVHGKLVVTTSPRVELMLTVAMLVAPTPAPGHYGMLDHPIAQAARTWFTSFADHPVVETTKQLFHIENNLVSGFACDAVTGFIICRNEPPDLGARYPHPRSALARANGESVVLDLLVEQLRDFYHSSRFASFWEEQTRAYQSIEKQIASYVEAGWTGEDVVATMEHYFGKGRISYILVPTPMERPAGGTAGVMGDDSMFACFDSTASREWVLHLLYHEFGHGFVNPLAEQHHRLVQRYEGLYEPLREAMRPWGYTNWTIALNEHILRAQNCRLRRYFLGDEAAEAQLLEEEAQGFRYIRALEMKLAEYETRRHLYPALVDFYPVLLEALNPFLTSDESRK
jgi:hypothetical protein